MLPADPDVLPATLNIVSVIHKVRLAASDVSPANLEVLPDNADARPVAADFVLVNHQVRRSM